MKKLLARRISERHAFTLVELLVVIAIIAILAAVTMNVGIMVINLAKKAKAQNTATQIQTSTLAYYTEYSVYPTPSGAAATDYMLNDTDSALNWGPLVECLSGMISPSTGTTSTETVFSNTRQIPFLNLKVGDVGNGTTGNKDAPLNPLPPPSAPTSKYFNIAIDADYDGVLGGSNEAVSGNWLPNFNATPFSATGGGGTSTAGVAVWANCTQNNQTTANWWVHTY